MIFHKLRIYMEYLYKIYKYNKDPFDIFCALRDKKNVFFLDSGLNLDGLGRFSFLGFEPEFILKTKEEENLFLLLRHNLNKFKLPVQLNKLSPFLGGFCGYLSYDLGLSLEKIRSKNLNVLDVPAAYLGFYNALIIIDHLKKRLAIFACGFPEKNSRASKLKAKERFRGIEACLSGRQALLGENQHLKAEAPEIKIRDLKSNFTHENYIRAINMAKEYIAEGEIYQINLSQRFTAECSVGGFSLYQRLRRLFPAAFSAYFDAGDFQIISSSPERFLSLEKSKVTTRPMKGTRPRGRLEDEDLSLKEELLTSEKDKAELLMIVDLERNDLGRVCEYESIKVTKPRILETYTTVFQTTAEIEGRLHKDKDRVDLLRACFPGGSITGCPKIRAMRIIDELEPTRRNIYTGALGYLDLAGNMDFNILIRTLLLKDGKVYFHVGGGIVADSDPEAEYQETLVKAKAIFEALGVEDEPRPS